MWAIVCVRFVVIFAYFLSPQRNAYVDKRGITPTDKECQAAHWHCLALKLIGKSTLIGLVLSNSNNLRCKYICKIMFFLGTLTTLTLCHTDVQGVLTQRHLWVVNNALLFKRRLF